MRRCSLVVALATCALVLFAPAGSAQLRSAARTRPHPPLPTDRIYGEPSPSGHLYAGVAWSADSKRISFFKERTSQHEASGKELWVMDTASGRSSLLVAADKLDSILAAPSTATQA